MSTLEPQGPFCLSLAFNNVQYLRSQLNISCICEIWMSIQGHLHYNFSKYVYLYLCGEFAKVKTSS